MKKAALILAAPLAMLAACAAPGSARTHMAAASAGSAQYCKRDRLSTSADSLTCTWSATISDACENTNLTDLPKSGLSSGPTAAGRCGNGQWLVSVTTK